MTKLFLFALLLFSLFCFSESFSVVRVDANRAANEKAHRTNYYRNRVTPVVKQAAVILRRATTFTLLVETDAQADPRGLFVGVQYLAPPHDQNGKAQWGGYLGWRVSYQQHQGEEEHHSTTATITIPAKASIGQYLLTVKGKTGKGVQLRFILLLNPFSSTDDVFYPRQSELSEYVINEEGIIWVGQNKDYEGKLWRYRQFEGSNLETSLSLLYSPSTSIGSAAAAAEPVAIARHISYVTAEHVCRGKWGTDSYTKGCTDGEYCCSARSTFPGTRTTRICMEPWAVHNTTIILSQYLNSRVSFQYCQCFVFAAIVNTISRGLGLPTRAVTNFNSAADHTGNGAIDQYYEEDSKGFLKHVSGSDSIWNFHVWNECYMKRPSQKGINLSGWQAFDGTPQVESDGRYQVGPASLNAIYRKSDLRFDTKFVVSEVDAPTNVWVRSKRTGGKFKLTKTVKNNPYDSLGTTGRKITTKRPGLISQDCLRRATIAQRACEADRLDLTTTYKAQVAPPRANGGVRRQKRDVDLDAEAGEGEGEGEGEDTGDDDRDDEDGKEKEGLVVEMVFPRVTSEEKVVQGDTITYGYRIKNIHDYDAVVHVLYKVKATEYTDEEIFPVDSLRETFTVPGQGSLDIIRKIYPFQYESLFSGEREHEDQAYMEFEMSVNVKNLPAFWFHTKRLFIHAKREEDRFF